MREELGGLLSTSSRVPWWAAAEISKQLIALGLHMGAEALQHAPGPPGCPPCWRPRSWGRVASSGLYCRSSCVDGVEVRHGVPALAAGDVHHVDEQAAAVDVAQEVVAQAGALAGALDDAGDVRHDEGDALLHLDHAQVGVEGGEVVVGDLGLGLG